MESCSRRVVHIQPSIPISDPVLGFYDHERLRALGSQESAYTVLECLAFVDDRNGAPATYCPIEGRIFLVGIKHLSPSYSSQVLIKAS